MRASIRPRKASPTSRFFPEIRNDKAASEANPPHPVELGMPRSGVNAPGNRVAETKRRSTGGSGGLFLTPPLHRRRDAHGLAVFRHRAPGNIDTGNAQLVDNGIVGQHVGG